MFEQFGFGKLPGGQDGFQLFIPTKGTGDAQYTRGGDPGIVKVQVKGDFQTALELQSWVPNVICCATSCASATLSHAPLLSPTRPPDRSPGSYRPAHMHVPRPTNPIHPLLRLQERLVVQ